MKPLARNLVVLFVLPAALVLACSSDDSNPAEDSGAQDAGPDLTDGGIDDDGLDWRSIADSADAVGDCDLEDDGCTADIADLLYAVEGDTISVKLETEEEFPTAGSFEVFLIPQSTEVPGLTFRLTGETLVFWTADCSTSAAKHDGCHWYTRTAPAGFEGGWEADRKVFTCSMSLTEAGLDGLDVLLMGVAASHEEVNATAEFTDRHPDDLWVTSQEILGLAEVSL